MFAPRFSILTGLLGIFLMASASRFDAAEAVQIVSHIRREALASSVLTTAGYSKRRHILEIEFCNGAVYRYLEVPVSVYQGLLSADSKARYYDTKIKGNYHSLRLRAAKSSRQVN
jgi:hypothetical protein